MWYTNAFDRAILNVRKKLFFLIDFYLILQLQINLQNLVLKNNSDAYDRFTKPMTNPFVKIHIFNYTNVERYRKRLDDKLHVQDVGPYVYE